MNLFIARSEILMSTYLPDTRPYPVTLSKNELLLYAATLSKDPDDANVARMLKQSLSNMLKTHQYQSLAVALAMAPTRAQYEIIWTALDDVLKEKTEGARFMVLPLVMVLGTITAKKIPLNFEVQAFQEIFGKVYPETKDTPFSWLPRIIRMEEFSRLTAADWVQGGKNPQSLMERLTINSPETLDLRAGHQVELGYVVGYQDAQNEPPSLTPRDQAPLFQFWNREIAAFGLTPFINPLPLMTPLTGLAEGAKMQKMMAFNIFLTDSIRAIRLLGEHPAAVIAAREGGMIEFKVEAQLSPKAIVYAYYWQLSPLEDLEALEKEWLSLFADCGVEALRVLLAPIEEGTPLPRYGDTSEREGINPAAKKR